MDIAGIIKAIPDFPRPGINFYDISPILAHPMAWRETVDRMATLINPYQPDRLVGIESRGFLLAAPLAFVLGIGFVMARKRGKLPGETMTRQYKLEYGEDALEIQTDGIEKGQRVVIIDDLLATGGTMRAACEVIKLVGATACAAFTVIELEGLGGREQLSVQYDSLLRLPA